MLQFAAGFAVFAVLIPFAGAVAAAVDAAIVAAVVELSAVSAGFAAAAAEVVRFDEDLILRLAKACSMEMILSRERAVWILSIVSVYISENQTNKQCL